MEHEEEPTTGAAEDEDLERDDEFDPEEIENDPAYNPDDEGLRDLKGG